jgi:hypothetical protein
VAVHPKVELASKLSPMPRPDWSIKACKKTLRFQLEHAKTLGPQGFKCSQGSCDWRHWWGSIESYMRTFTQYLDPVDACAVFSICSIFYCQCMEASCFGCSFLLAMCLFTWQIVGGMGPFMVGVPRKGNRTLGLF